VPLVLGVGSDVAGSSVEVRDAATGRLVATGAAPHAAAARGRQHPEVWWDGMVDAIAATGLQHEVAAMAVAAQRQALVMLDGAGSPLRPASLRTDPVARSSAPALVERLGAAKLARSTGQVPGAHSPLARLAAIAEADPPLVTRAAAVLGAAELLTLRLTGRFVADRASAAGSGWWDPATGRWRTDLLERAVRPGPEAGWARVLAQVVGPAQPADRVRATVHDILGLRGRPIVAAGTDDLAARALAAALPPGAIGLLLDADPVVVALRDAPVTDPEGAVASLADATGRHLPAVEVLDVASVLTTTATLLGTDAHGLAALAADAPARRPGDLVVVLGHRTGGPGGRPTPRAGSILALRAHHTPADVARAALHGVAAELLDAVDAVAGDEGIGDAGVLLAGEVGACPGLAEAVADLLGDVVIVGPTAAAATGACIVAAAALDGVDPLEVTAAWGIDAGEAVEPSGSVDGPGIREAIHAAQV
jgi:xylulokinase